jgi:hypothetical protein
MVGSGSSDCMYPVFLNLLLPKYFRVLIYMWQWTQVEAGVYLISACLPTWRTFLDRLGKKRFFSRMTAPKQSDLYYSRAKKPRGNQPLPLNSLLLTDVNEVTIKGHDFYILEDGQVDSTGSQNGIRVTTNFEVEGVSGNGV